jgi:hypothetical protein
MEKPKWQRARIVKMSLYSRDNLVGKLVWARERPYLTPARARITNERLGPRQFIDVAINDGSNHFMVIPIEDLELLPEFHDDPLFISWEDFLACGMIQS